MRRKNLFICLFLIVFVLFFGACSSSSKSDGSYAGAGMESAGDKASGGESSNEGGTNQIQAGQLTACAYDDNLHYDFWKELITSNQEGQGYFKSFHDSFTFTTDTRIEISVPKGSYFKISLLDANDNPIYSAINDANGKCYLYAPSYQEAYKVMFEYYEKDNLEPIKLIKTIGQSFELTDEVIQRAKDDIIQLMFVIDTTGSMGDEIKYLNNLFEKYIINLTCYSWNLL